MSRKWRVIAGILLVASTALVYSRAIKSPFQFDDEAGVVLNASIQNITDLKAIFTYKPELPRPLFNLSLAIDYAIYGLNPAGYHVTNLLIHILCAFAVWWLAGEVARSVKNGYSRPAGWQSSFFAPIAAAFIFALHPIATEPTIYIWSRSSSMMTLFCLTSVALYIKANRAARCKTFLALSWLAFIMAMLSKEEAIVLPLLLLATDYSLFRKDGRMKRLAAAAPFWLVPIAAVVYRLIVKATMYDVVSWRASEADEFAELVMERGVAGMIPVNFFTQAKVGLCYALKLLWPINLSVDHGVTFELGAPGLLAVIGILFLVSSAIKYFYFKTHYPLISLAIAFFFIPLAIFYLIPVSDVMVERRLYLPLAGFAILLGNALCQRTKNLGVFFLLIFSLLAAMGCMTYMRSNVWQDRLALWSDAARVSPGKLRPRVVLARYMYESGNVYRAIHENHNAIRIKPNYDPPIVNLGLIYLNQGDYETAEKYFRQAVHWHPGADFNAHFNLALTLSRMGRNDEAIKELEETIRLSEGHALARVELGRIYAQGGRPDIAVRWLKEALQINPELATARMNLGMALIDLGQTIEGTRQLELAAKSDPTDTLVQVNLGFVYLSQNRLPEAEKAFANAAQDTGRPEALFGLAQVRLRQGISKEAAALLNKFLSSANLEQRPELAPMAEQAKQILGTNP